MKKTITEVAPKPVQAKPMFYACLLFPLQEIGKGMGYNLVVHGSMHRDLDLIAIPWTDNPAPEMELIQAFDNYLRGASYETKEKYLHSVLPGKRNSYVINLNRSSHYLGYANEHFNYHVDEKYYLDISITPLV